MYTVGELTELKPEPLTESINQIGIPEEMLALNTIFNREKRLIGTDRAKWTVRRENRRMGSWNVQGRPAQRIDPRGHRELTASFGHIFLSIALDEAFLLWAKSPDDNVRERAAAHIVEKQAELVSRRNILLEYVCWQILTTGKVSIDISEGSETGITFDAEFGVDYTNHVRVNATLDWPTVDTKILSDTTSDPDETWSGLARVITRYTGLPCGEVVMNRMTNKYLLGNNEVYKWVSDRTKDAIIEDAMVKRLDGRDCTTYEAEYEDASGASVGFVPDNITVWLPPRNRRDSFAMFHGECLVPNKGAAYGFNKAVGMVSWAKFNDDPAEVRLYLKENVLPVPMDPDAFLSQDVDVP